MMMNIILIVIIVICFIVLTMTVIVVIEVLKMTKTKKITTKCSICGEDYEDRCLHNPSHNFPIERNGFRQGKLFSVKDCIYYFYECKEARDWENAAVWFETLLIHYKNRGKRKVERLRK